MILQLRILNEISLVDPGLNWGVGMLNVTLDKLHNVEILLFNPDISSYVPRGT